MNMDILMYLILVLVIQFQKEPRKLYVPVILQKKDIAVSIVRPGHIYGPTATRKDNRVSTAFAYNASDGKDIIMKSDGAQIRSYCYMLDCASAILYVLLKGKKGKHIIFLIQIRLCLFENLQNIWRKLEMSD